MGAVCCEKYILASGGEDKVHSHLKVIVCILNKSPITCAGVSHL